jgi:serine/threonine-protein kinase
VRQIAAALDAAQSAHMIHRDVKPANILLTGDDFACLVDFGLANAATDARLTSSGTTIGTFAYMAPERLSNAEVSHRADIYSLACVLYECLTGSPPYAIGDLPALITAHLTAPIPRPSQQRPQIPAAFDDVIARGMAKNPDDRYASAGESARAAHRALSATDQDRADTILASTQVASDRLKHDGWEQSPPATADMEMRWWRHPAMVIAAVMGIVLVAALFFIGFELSRDRQSPPTTGTASATPTFTSSFTPQPTPVSPPAPAPRPVPPATSSITSTVTTSSTYTEPTETAVAGSSCSDQGKLARDANTGEELYCATFPKTTGCGCKLPQM